MCVLDPPMGFPLIPPSYGKYPPLDLQLEAHIPVPCFRGGHGKVLEEAGLDLGWRIGFGFIDGERLAGWETWQMPGEQSERPGEEGPGASLAQRTTQL